MGGASRDEGEQGLLSPSQRLNSGCAALTPCPAGAERVCGLSHVLPVSGTGSVPEGPFSDPGGQSPGQVGTAAGGVPTLQLPS